MRGDIVPGGTFPDYQLTDHAKKRRRLSELQGDDPLILVLSRGHFCPKDHQQHLKLAAFQPELAVGYTRIVTISTDSIVETREFRASVGATWTFLSDAGRKPSIEDLRRDLREVTREIRPDWDLGTQRLREAWEAGDHSSFFDDEDLDPSLRGT